MNLHYKIVEVWPSDHLIVVRYWTDILSEEFLASNSDRKEDGTPVRCRSDVSFTLPIPAPTGKELETIIIKQAPVEWLKTLENVQIPEVDTSLSHILELKDKTITVGNVERINNPTSLLTDEEIQKMIDNVNSEK